MKAYIINLERSIERKEYMSKQLERLPFLSSEFVKAVDGRFMTQTEILAQFDVEGFCRRYMKKPRPGEIGATLSHRECYARLLKSKEECALILEDDVVLEKSYSDIIKECALRVKIEHPCIILLSGWYYYCKTSPFNDRFRLATVFDGYSAFAYIINRSAARILLNNFPDTVADDWLYVKKRGVSVEALLPHLVEVNSSITTTLSNVNVVKVNGKVQAIINRFVHRVKLKVLKWCGNFESSFA